jgi:hypothetical protein
MAQLFSRRANVYSRVILAAVVILVCGAGWVTSEIFWSPYTTYVGIPLHQPVPFSHKHHVAGLGIDCRYCHTSVETSSFAGLPQTEICMNCHSQIWVNSPMLEPVRASYRGGKSISWVRVHNLADFVYFNHSIHVAKGVGCVTCHGQVDRMPLTQQVVSLHMEWCLDCHRNPERFVRPREQVFNMHWQPADEGDDPLVLGNKLVREYGIKRDNTSCSICHR